MTYINHYPIPSYNYNGTTLVYARDLEAFGFDVWYNEYKNDVTITRNKKEKDIELQLTFRPLESQLTKKCMDIYSNDIPVYIGGQLCDSYSSSDGRTIIKIGDLAKLDDISVAWVPEINAVKVWVKDGLEMRNTPFAVRRIDNNYKYYDSCDEIDIYISTVWFSNANGIVLTVAEVEKNTKYCTDCTGTLTITDIIDANGKSRLKSGHITNKSEATLAPYFMGFTDDILAHNLIVNNDELLPATTSERGGLIKYRYSCTHGNSYKGTLKADCLPYE